MSATKEKLNHIDQLHFEHRLWSSGAGFYSDELSIYQNRLEEIASKNNIVDIAKQVEHFQNQFILQKEQLDILTHDIMMHDRSLSRYAQKHPVAIDHVLFTDHAVLRNKNEVFVKLFQELKSEFTAFLERHL